MQYRHTILALVAATTVMAAPLNINMGAYSPALVVGDGAIGFKGTESVTNLMNTLKGAAASSAAANGAAAAAPAAEAPAAGAAATAPITQLEPQGMGKNVLPLVTRAESFENGATLTAEEIEILEDEEDETSISRRSSTDGAVLTAEEIEILEDAEEEDDDDSVSKRDVAGFNAALAYATAAMKTQPEVQLGTGEGGSGVGITVKPAGAATTKNGTAKRNVLEA
jgi:hypothetical protein